MKNSERNMRLPHTAETFSHDAWEHTFGAFVKANKSHWRGAPYDAVMNMLRSKGRFEFTVTGMGTWTSKFVLVVLEDGHLDASFVPNTGLSGLMQTHLQKMQHVFEEEINRH
jgi:hypothetical protein